MKTPISYYGGKQNMLKHILPLVPKHKIYTEALAGGAALFWAKEPGFIEVLNDINGNLINFYKVLKYRFNELHKRIDATLHSRGTFDYAKIVYNFPQFFESVERAWALWVISKMGFASKLDGSFGYDRKSNSIAKKLKGSKELFTDELSKRLENTQIECTNALRIISSRDTNETFHFVDPPYINSDCGHYAGTFNLMDFEELLELLSVIQGKFMLTMFPHEVLSEYITRHSWHVVEVERTISAAKSKRRKVKELIVMNYTI